MIATGLLACFHVAPIDTFVHQEPRVVPVYQTEDLSIWKYAHQGNYNLTHKKFLMREMKTIDQAYCSALIMAYLYYRMGDEDSMMMMFEALDKIIEQEK